MASHPTEDQPPDETRERPRRFRAHGHHPGLAEERRAVPPSRPLRGDPGRQRQRTGREGGGRRMRGAGHLLCRGEARGDMRPERGRGCGRKRRAQGRAGNRSGPDMASAPPKTATPKAASAMSSGSGRAVAVQNALRARMQRPASAPKAARTRRPVTPPGSGESLCQPAVPGNPARQRPRPSRISPRRSGVTSCSAAMARDRTPRHTGPPAMEARLSASIPATRARMSGSRRAW